MDFDTGMVVITSVGEGIIVKGIERRLSDAGIRVAYSLPNPNALREFDEVAAIYVIYLADSIDSLAEAMVYINDVVKAGEKDLIIIGEESDKLDLQLSVPDMRISEWFVRPLDMDAFVKGIRKMLTNREKRLVNRSILIVDDDPSYVRIVREWLKDDYQVFIVTSGMQAISFLMKKSVDLVLLDYEMPVTTGPQVLRMLRSEPDTANLPIVFLTGISDEESVKQVIALKPEGYILKSTKKPDLLHWLEVFFANRA